MNVGSLFSGIGGLDLGLERAGMTVRWQSEVDPYACRVLAKHWPHVPNLGDVTTIDWSTVEPVDLICGGYPCQPFSLAGARAGTADRRHLWPYFADALRHLRPRYALLENVPGHLSLGFGRVLGDLAELGYDTEWQCIPAAAVGAPHLRWRVFVVAHADGDGEPGEPVDAFTRSGVVVSDADRDGHGRAQDGPRVGGVDGGDEGTARERERSRPLSQHRGPEVADADSTRSQGHGAEHGLREDRSQGEARRRRDDDSVADADGMARWSPESFGGRRGAVGEPGAVAGAVRRAGVLGDHWAVEPDVGRVADGVPARVDRLRALGNAVVPAVAELVGRRILNATQ